MNRGLKTMDTPLPPDLEKFVDGLIEAGDYRSVPDAVQAGLRLLQERQRRREAARTRLRDSIQEAEDALKSGCFKDYSEEELGRLVDEIEAQGRRLLQRPESGAA
jgi:putative addiction module CopG family antidote